MKASVTPQSSSDMAQMSNSAQNNTAETKKGIYSHVIYTIFTMCVGHCVLVSLAVRFSAVSDTALVPNVSIDDLKQMKVSISSTFCTNSDLTLMILD